MWKDEWTEGASSPMATMACARTSSTGTPNIHPKFDGGTSARCSRGSARDRPSSSSAVGRAPGRETCPRPDGTSAWICRSCNSRSRGGAPRTRRSSWATSRRWPGSFDGVVAFYVFMHVPQEDLAPTFERIFDWLRWGGRLMLSLSTIEAEDRVEEWIGAPMFFARFTPGLNERLLREAGFELELSEVRDEVDPTYGPTDFHWVIREEARGRRRSLTSWTLPGLTPAAGIPRDRHGTPAIAMIRDFTSRSPTRPAHRSLSTLRVPRSHFPPCIEPESRSAACAC
jgi:hypothetical protein